MNANDRKVKDSIENIRTLLSEGMLHKINEDVLELTDIVTADGIQSVSHSEIRIDNANIIRAVKKTRDHIADLMNRLDIILGIDDINNVRNDLLTKQDFITWVEKELRIVVNKMIHDKIIELVNEKQEQK